MATPVSQESEGNDDNVIENPNTPDPPEPEREFTLEEKKQIEKMDDILGSDPIDLETLRVISPEGFVLNEYRIRIWPLLLGVGEEETSEPITPGEGSKHAYFDQVKKDTVRSMTHFDTTKGLDGEHRAHEQAALERILHGVFSVNPDLHYTQGFHDVCSVFYLICGEELGLKLSKALAKRHLRDAVREDLSVFQFIIGLLFPLISVEDGEVFDFLQESNVTPYFALSWLLTWFSHNLERMDDIARLYDFFLASHPLMPLYFSVALITTFRTELLQCECDNPAIHVFFQNFAWSIDFKQIIHRSLVLFKKTPPSSLFRQFALAEVSALPSDTPFLAYHVQDLETPKDLYGLWNLNSVWDPRNRRFWTHIGGPVSVAVLSGVALTYFVSGQNSEHMWETFSGIFLVGSRA